MNNLNNEPDINQTEMKEKKPVIRYMIFGLSIAVGIILCFMKKFNAITLKDNMYNAAYDFGYSIGSIIIYLAVLFGFCQILIKTIKVKKINIYIVVNMVFICYLYTGVISNIEISKEKQYENLAAEKIISFSKRALDGEHIEKEEFDSSSYGRYSDLVKLCQQYYIDIQELKENIEQSSKKVDIPTVLEGKTYGDNQKLNDINKTIDEVISVYDSYGKNCQDALDRYISGIEKLSIPEPYKKSIIQSLKSPDFTSDLDNEDYITSQKAILYSTKEIIKFMQSIEGKYTLQNGKILFAVQKDFDEYNKLIEELHNSYNKADEVIERLDSKNKKSKM